MGINKPWDTVGQVGLKVDTLIEMIKDLNERLTKAGVPEVDPKPIVGWDPYSQGVGPQSDQGAGLTQEEKDQLGTAAIELDNPYNPRK